MDPYATLTQLEASASRKDHLALVLLDEMNLARVEYYFSEFLSRLEARPRFGHDQLPQQRKDANFSIDIRGLEKTLSLYPSHNVLFAGTMNDDESTQALSDKVLDRANIPQFAAPRDFTTPHFAGHVKLPTEAQAFSAWRGWIRQSDAVKHEQDQLNSVIQKLADVMEDCGRPFGHRLRDAMVAYVANYPRDANGRLNIRDPLADQVEFRIMPKLRGLEIGGHRPQFDVLRRIIRDDLDDVPFSERLDELCTKQEQGSGLFVWRGIARVS